MNNEYEREIPKNLLEQWLRINRYKDQYPILCAQWEKELAEKVEVERLGLIL